MAAFAWDYIALPLAHWLAVTLLFFAISIFIDARRIIKQGRKALGAAVNAEMAEITLQVKRADGSIEPPMAYRTYRNPVKAWGWAIWKATAGKVEPC